MSASATLPEIESLLQAYSKRVVGSPWEKAIDGEIANYRLCKADEAKLHADIDAQLEKIRSLAQPVAHQISLQPVP